MTAPPYVHELQSALAFNLSAAHAAHTSLLAACASHHAKAPETVEALAKEFIAVLTAVRAEASAVVGAVAPSDVKPKVAAAAKEKVDVSGAVSTVHGCSLLAPRGRFDMHALPATDGRGACLALVSNTPTGGALTVPCDDVERVLVLEKPKEAGTLYLMLHLRRDAPLQHGKQKLPCVLFVVKPGRLDIAHPLQPGARLQDAAGTVLCMLFGMFLAKSPETSDQNVFCGSKGNHQLAATHKVNPGFVFPLKSGLAFVERPALFMPADEVTRVELGRANGTASTFDLTVELVGGMVHEFGMLPREELEPLKEYLGRRKFGQAKAVKAGQEGEQSKYAAVVAAVEESSDDEDENFDPLNPEGIQVEEEGADEDEDEEGDEKEGGKEEGAAGGENDNANEEQEEQEQEAGEEDGESSGSDVELVNSQELESASEGEDDFEMVAADNIVAGKRKR